LAAALLALLPPPLSWLWPVGLGLGIWTLIAIHQPEVKSAFGCELPDQPPHLSSGPGPVGRSVVPIISRKAIVGACLGAVFVAIGLFGSTPFMWRMSPDNSFLNGPVFVSLQAAVRGIGLHLDPGWMVPEVALAYFLLGLLLCVGLDHLIVRACWRAARRPAR
jgi:hypothetical protein